MAVLATAAVVGAAAGSAIPANARSGLDPACKDPARTTPTITVEGRVIDCRELDGQPAGTTGTGTTTTADPEPPADPDPVPAQTEPSPPTTTDPDPAPVEPMPADPDPDPRPADPAPADPAPAAATPAAPAPATAPAATGPTGPPPAPASADTAHTPSKDEGKDHAAKRRTPRHTAARPAHRRSVPARKGTQTVAAASGSAATYAALPAAWTSLTPIVIPASGVAGFPIPPFLLPIYQAAGAQYGVPWELLASINEIETDFGRNTSVSSAGALGWMQFMPESWARWGVDGDGDARRDPRNPVDAIFGAARYLRDAGIADDLGRAVFAYNHADWYVDRVVKRAREFAGLDATVVSALTAQALDRHSHLYRARGNPFNGDASVVPSAGQALLLTKAALTRLVLDSKDIGIYAGGREDIAAGRIDRRVLAMLLFLARSGLHPTVSCLETGHSLYTTSGNVSAHSYGHAVDISAINGIPIMGHQGADSITALTLEKLMALQGFLRPNQIISLMHFGGIENTLAMADHDDHIHVGFPRAAKAPDGTVAGEATRLRHAFHDRTQASVYTGAR